MRVTMYDSKIYVCADVILTMGISPPPTVITNASSTARSVMESHRLCPMNGFRLLNLLDSFGSFSTASMIYLATPRHPNRFLRGLRRIGRRRRIGFSVAARSRARSGTIITSLSVTTRRNMVTAASRLARRRTLPTANSAR